MVLTNKVAVVTGISKGIGHALCKQLLAKGAVVYGLGRNNATDLSSDQFHFICCDIRNLNEVKETFRQIFSAVKHIDILINNAGLGYFGFLENLAEEHWHEMFDTNINGMFYCCKQVLPSMKKQQHGHVINIASTAALEGIAQVSGYCATKWAVKGLSESLYKELRDFGIKVTCVYPGSTKTDFFRNSATVKPHNQMLMPEDVALLVVQSIEMPDNFNSVNLEIRPLHVRKT
ncbi:MAG: SDR family oxidoreductase [Bacteroidia bacterium]|nr:SDR family oxidoreductase [Bacteroidia bacterium]